ncbi:MAG: TonB-dependent receptor [Sphingomonadales bacterium]|nr:TonB-dependent receptor [Sphingomonadales bacterium]MBD3772641.1 TonB-dependent receptor [Paracoccaceae bacterium]
MRRHLLVLGALAIPAGAQANDGASEPQIVVLAPGGAIDADEAAQIGRDAIAGGTSPDLAGALARDVPGVSLSEAQGNAWQAGIGWRGYSVSALQGTEQGMAVYLDGVRFNQPFGDTLALDLLPEAALEGAELREASPVYGRNALGGAILLATANGRETTGGEAELRGDSFGGYGGSLTLGGKRALLVVEAIRDAGWRDDSPSRLYRLFGSAGVEGAGWSLDAKLVAADTRLHGNGVAPVELLDADYAAVFTRPDITDSRYWRLTLLPRIDIGESGRIEGAVHFQHLRRDSENGDLADFGACDADAAVLCLGDDDEGFADPLRDPAGTAVAADPGIDDYAVRNLGHERTRGGGASAQYLDERETARGMRRLSFGFAWESYRTRFDADSELAYLTEGREVIGLGIPIAADSGAITPVSVTAHLRDFALFASAEIPLTPQLSVEAGLRWSVNRVQLEDHLGTALNGDHRFRDLAPSLEVDFRPAEGWALNTGVAETSRNPTPAELSCADPEAPCALANFFVADPPLDPVKARNWHAGLSREAGPVTFQLSAWRSDSRNDIRHIASGVRGRAYFANLGRSRRQGIELSGEWRTGAWRIGADYGFTDARFRSDFTISSPANPAADEDGLVSVAAGDRLPGIPAHTANLRLGYDRDGWGVEGALRYRSGQFLIGDEGNDQPRTPGYAVFDLRGHVALAKGVRLVWEVRNLFDRRYATFGTFAEIDEIDLAEAPGASDPRAYAPGMPRRFSLAVRAAF